MSVREIDLADETSAAIRAAQDALEEQARRAAVTNDPVRHYLAAMSAGIGAMHKLFVDGTLTLRALVQEAKSPINEEDLRRIEHSALMGSQRYAHDMVAEAAAKRLYKYTAIGVAALVVALIIGMGGGWWLFEQQNAGVLSWGRVAMQACSEVPVVNGECHATIKLR